MKKYKLYLLDLDGTIYNGTEKIKYAREFVDCLNEKNIDYMFVTNNSTNDETAVVKKLASFGIKTSEKNVFTSSEATALYLKEHNLTNIYVIGESGLKTTLLRNGLTILEKNSEAVIVGLDRNITYEKMSTACMEILNGSKFIVTNPDKLIPTERGLCPSNGAQMKYLEFCTSTKPVIIGKPNELIIKYAMKKFDYSKEDVVMIGDNYDTDILVGINAGIDTIHVQTGVTSKDEVLQKEKQPTYTVKNLSKVIN